MSFEDLRPVISGIIGALLFAAIAPILLRRLPAGVNSKPAAALVDENRRIIRVANMASLIGVISMFVMYLAWNFAKNDWRPLGVGLGFAVSAPVIVIHFGAMLLRRNLREVVVAYAITQKLPLFLLYGLSVIGGAIFVLSVQSLMR